MAPLLSRLAPIELGYPTFSPVGAPAPTAVGASELADNPTQEATDMETISQSFKSVDGQILRWPDIEWPDIESNHSVGSADFMSVTSQGR